MKQKASLKQVNEKIVPALNIEDGSIEATTKKEFVVVEGDINFYMVFTHIDHIIEKTLHMPVVKLIHWIGSKMKPEDNCISLNLTTKIEIAKLMNISLPGIGRAITILKNEDVLMPYGTTRSAMYKVNPTYIWKGSTKGPRQKAMKEFLETLRVSNMPDREKKIVEMQKNYEKAIAIERATERFDFGRISPAKYEPYKAA